MSANKSAARNRAARKYQRQYGAPHAEALEAVDNGLTAEPIRLRYAHPDGVPFVDWLRGRTDDVRKAQRVWAFIQEWDYLRDELNSIRHSNRRHPQRLRCTDPTYEEFAERWNRTLEETLEDAQSFRELVPGEHKPTRLIRMLWAGLHQVEGQPFSMGSLGAVRVVDFTEEDRQRWELEVLTESLSEPFGLGRSADYEFQRGRPGTSPTIDLVIALEERGLMVIAVASDVQERQPRIYASITDAVRRRLERLQTISR